jgi:hypothetical protein
MSYQQFYDDLRTCQEKARQLGSQHPNAAWLDQAVELAQHILDVSQTWQERPAVPLYKINCMDCGTYIGESEFEDHSELCARCDAERREEQREFARDAAKYGSW